MEKSLAEKIVPEPYTAKTTNCHSTFSLHPITEDFVSRSINLLRTNKALGLDKVSARLLKDAVDVITPSLTLRLINLFKQIFSSYMENSEGCTIVQKGR